MYIQNRNRFTDIENKLVVIKGEWGGRDGQTRGMGLTETKFYI